MTRYPDWALKLEAAFLHNRNRPFEWGKHDCALFACNVIQVMTGKDLAFDFRGKYTTELGAARAIREFNGGSGDLDLLAEKVCAKYGMEEIPPVFAQRGDVVIALSADSQKALCIVGLCGRLAYGAGPDGLTRLPMASWIRAWRVG